MRPLVNKPLLTESAEAPYDSGVQVPLSPRQSADSTPHSPKWGVAAFGSHTNLSIFLGGSSVQESGLAEGFALFFCPNKTAQNTPILSFQEQALPTAALWTIVENKVVRGRKLGDERARFLRLSLSSVLPACGERTLSFRPVVSTSLIG